MEAVVKYALMLRLVDILSITAVPIKIVLLTLLNLDANYAIDIKFLIMD